MLLTKHHAIPEGWQPEYEGLAELEALLQQSTMAPEQQVALLEAHRKQARMLNEPPLRALELHHTGASATQNWDRRLIEEWMAAGLVSMSQGVLTLHTQEDDLKYTIVHMPGTYCCHCDATLDDDPSGASGRRHVQQMHAGAASPDASNPAGFRQTHAYECVLDEHHHAQWNAQAVREAREAGGRPRGGGAAGGGTQE